MRLGHLLPMSVSSSARKGGYCHWHGTTFQAEAKLKHAISGFTIC